MPASAAYGRCETALGAGSVQAVFFADRLFDGTGAAPIEPAVLVVEQGRVLSVGRPSEVAEPPAATRTAYPGCTLVPGLIDAHVHLVFSASGNPLADLQAEDDLALVSRAIHNAQTALRAGITTVKDLGGRGGVTLAVRQAIAQGLLPGSRVLAAGAPITTSGGHCYWLGGEADGVDEVRTRVRQLHHEGVDLIKVMASGGGMTAGSNLGAAQYTVVELTALVEEARRLGKTVAAHAHGTAGIAAAVAAGVQTIEHCSWVAPDGSPDVAYDERVAAQMTERGIFLVPALSGGVRNLRADPAHLTPRQRAGRARRPLVIAAHRRSLELGVELAAGTDAGAGRTTMASLPHELRVYQEYLGLSPAQCLRAATLNAARSAGVEADLGTLQPGRRADFLVVPGNPLADLTALEHPRAVYQDGRLEVEAGRLVRS
jgi:imidazolonepropionase-like amidohydrolase